MDPEFRYEIAIWWSAEDQAFLAEVPDLPGCVTDGPSYEAALANALEAIRAWIDAARELGRPIPDPGERPHAV
jgi:predicted RNase H-like HicB family nuclease